MKSDQIAQKFKKYLQYKNAFNGSQRLQDQKTFANFYNIKKQDQKML